MIIKKKLSINTIAKEAGVSPSTVSRVLTGNAKVNPEKKNIIENIINKYNYKPNYANGALLSASKNTLGIILPDITHPFFGEAFLGAETKALERGYGILLGNTMNDRESSGHKMETMLFNLMLERKVNGILLLGGSIDDLHLSEERCQALIEIASRIPLIAPGSANPPWGGSSIIANDQGGIKKVIHYLNSLKHKKFGFLGGEINISTTIRRSQALIEVIDDLELEYRRDWFIHSGFDMYDGVSSMKELLQQQELPTAVLCVNDLVALGAMHAAHKYGLRVPEDISIVGCDNLPFTSYLSPPLTTIDLKAREEGGLGVDLLIDRIEGKKNVEHIVIEAEVILRDSCRRIND